MPRRASTKKNNDDKKNIEYIVRGSSPLYSGLSVLSFILVVSAIVLQYLELTTEYGFSTAIFF